MNKNYFRTLLALPAVAFVMYSFSSGPGDFDVSGSPGDGNDCTMCHASTPLKFNAIVGIDTDIPRSGYELNTKYTITVTGGASSTSNKHGFQMVSENSSNEKVGEFILASGLRLDDNNTRVSHSTPLVGSNTWTIEWTSPSTDQGDVTFYAAVNAADGIGGNSGDEIVKGNATVVSAVALGVSEFFESQFAVYPNPTSNGSTNLELPAHMNNASVIVYNYLGQSVKQQQVTTNKSSINLEGLSSGIYYMSIETSEGNLSKSIVIK